MRSSAPGTIVDKALSEDESVSLSDDDERQRIAIGLVASELVSILVAVDGIEYSIAEDQ
jgi:hypothetical protein